MSISISDKVSQEAQEDILELADKIELFKDEKIDEEKFRAFRLARGVYGQRQQGVQMLRIKLPYGRMTAEQLVRMADLSEKYTHGNLHLTTRQDVQFHYVKLEDAPEIWAGLEEVGVTTKEACGNTVRNLTGSPEAGIDPKEPFDITPYAHETFKFFLRNPICLEMGRKIKPAFSSSSEDTAFTYIHDFGYIPVIKDGEKGFKVVIGGGLGSQAYPAATAYEFLPTNQLIPFMEAAIRVFDRYGERSKRTMARMKFLIHSRRGIGFDKFMELVEIEKTANKVQSYEIDTECVPTAAPQPEGKSYPEVEIDEVAFEKWMKTNVFEQKQKGFYGVRIRVPLGDMNADTSRKVAALSLETAADDIRLTVNQRLLFRYVRKEALRYLYAQLCELGLGKFGYGTIADITSCPGTVTCNLAVTSSPGLSNALEEVIEKEYEHLIFDTKIDIKMSGCMNSCGQHMIANIGFHGSTIRNKTLVAPGVQVLLGGGSNPGGEPTMAEKIVSVPSKKADQALRLLLDDYQENALEGEYFNDYYRRQGKKYFVVMLKPLGDTSKFVDADYLDWGSEDKYVPAVGVGECAGATLDLVTTIVMEAEEKLQFADRRFGREQYADAIYFAYTAMITGAKALLLSIDVSCNTHISLIADFDKHFVETNEVTVEGGFAESVLSINKQAPSKEVAVEFIAKAKTFYQDVLRIREQQIAQSADQETKEVVGNAYKA